MSQTTERFELQTRLAAGNAGLVYRGIDKATRRRVALKLLIETGLPYPLDGPALLRDVARMRRTAGNNIAQLLEAIDDEEVGVVLVYEYADGANWTDAAKARKLDGAQAVDVAAQLLSALAVGEAIRAPHGELKPMNLVLGELPGGRLFVWVLDWGLARYRPEPPPDALPWMSPERLEGAPASSEGDLFAMGACLCWLLTGTVPVPGETRDELAAAWRKFPANALAQVRPDLPVKFTRWVGGLLDPNPKKRLGTVAEARQALAALDPPAPPVLPEIFRPRPKSPYSTVASPARSVAVPVPRVVAVPRAVAVPRVAEHPADEPAAVPVEEGVVAETAPSVDEEATFEPEPEAWSDDVEPAPGGSAGTAPGQELEALPEQQPSPEPVRPPATVPAPVYVARSGACEWLLALFAVAILAGLGVWYFHRSPPGTRAVPGAPAEVLLRRELAPRAAYCDDTHGGTWWYGFSLAHFPPPGQAGVHELQCNLFSDSDINDVIRLTFTESGGRISVVSLPARGSATLPGPASEAKRILVGIKATPAGPGTFNVELDLWANADAAHLGPPALSAFSGKSALPSQLGALFQKRRETVATTTQLDALRIGKTPQSVLP